MLSLRRDGKSTTDLQGFVALPQGSEGGAPLRQQPLLLGCHGLQIRLRLRQRFLTLTREPITQLQCCT